ncbi:CynX/NimT family MFS transporter [Aromatoleum diolicum]|uniref:MFS transporter n=1 Tax=Aromatoleum diolicum TaxID=75796 RepID=A0ABX1QCD0_9RHOO|nr:MFS transporter [Aromatoleum diolicum]NMG75147.1 MFS transporter [Aromatoleum diolicum]
MKTITGTILLALLAGCLAAAQIGKVPPAIHAVREDLLLSLVQAGWMATAINAMTATLGVAVGVWMARFGAQRGLLWGLILLALGSALGAEATVGAFLIGSRVFEGLGFVLVVVSAPSLIAAALAHDPARRRSVLSLWSCYMPVGMAAMMTVAPLLLERYGWRGLWWWNSGAIVACIIVALGLRRRLAAPDDASPGRMLKVTQTRLFRPGPWLMGACFCCYSAIWFMLATWLPSFAVEHMGYTPRGAAWLTAIAVAANIGGNLSASYWAAQDVPRWGLLAGVQIMLGVLGWFVFSAGFDPTLRSIAAIIACGAAGALPATVMAGIPFHACEPAEIAVGNGIVMQCSNLGSFVGVPAIAALATSLGGWDGGRWLIPVLASIGVLAAWSLRGIERRMNAAALALAPATGELVRQN